MGLYPGDNKGCIFLCVDNTFLAVLSKRVKFQVIKFLVFDTK